MVLARKRHALILSDKNWFSDRIQRHEVKQGSIHRVIIRMIQALKGTKQAEDAHAATTREMAVQDFNNVFPSDIEALYDNISTQRFLRKRAKAPRIVAKHGTSFLDLPRELRDEIYRYALLTTRVHRIRERSSDYGPFRFEEKMPDLLNVIPIFADEILEIHYEQNLIRYSVDRNDDYDYFLDWVHYHGLSFVQHVRNLQVRHRYKFNPTQWCERNAFMTTTIMMQSDGSIAVSTRDSRSPDDCQCSVEKLIHERLSREDALADAHYLERLEEYAEYGPVLGYALQVSEAVRLSQSYERMVIELPELQRLEVHRKNPTKCVMCDKRKWAFQY